MDLCKKVKKIKRYLLIISGICVIFLLIVDKTPFVFSVHPVKEDDVPGNDDSFPYRQFCIHPQLDVNDSVMLNFIVMYSRENCEFKENWVFIQNGTLQFSETVLKNYSHFTCDYYPIERIGDYNVTWGDPTLNIPSGFQITSDSFRIRCRVSGVDSYDGLHSGVAYTRERAERVEAPLEKGFQGLSIAILGYDSMSRMSWLRRLPKTRKYFHDELGAIELESHNIVGDGTTAVLFPMLTGKFEWELPESRRNFPGAITLDTFPFLWHAMKKAGYLTSWANAAPNSAPLNYRMMGFLEPPTDFYTRPFYLALQNHTVAYPKYCIGSQSFSQVWLNYFRDIFVMYRNKRKFLFHFLVDMSHDDNNLITKMDDDTRDLIKFLNEEDYLNNTLLILMGDHGARYSAVRSTWSGKLEERLPYFSFLFPKWFQDKYPEAINNLRTNTKRLTTPFDINETFKDFLNFNGTGRGSLFNRGISLFKEIPLERRCEHAGIAPHWCACLAWRKVSVHETGASHALQTTLHTLNKFTAAYRLYCALLYVANVTAVTKLETRKEVLKFSKTDADGGIYKIDFEDEHQSGVALYQLTFHTMPGGGHFEATVTHDVSKKSFTVSEKEISRINKYGNDPACILDKNRQIRQYCYCKKNLMS
ncbi:unnamed protein product [Lymnaea stagnalis]|uniref:DUF229 domain containing protein n=1 Tax=Lymnaea stagnalis TaxID=6523 RepID=A0AAV2HNP6_LYMST